MLLRGSARVNHTEKEYVNEKIGRPGHSVMDGCLPPCIRRE